VNYHRHRFVTPEGVRICLGHLSYQIDVARNHFTAHDQTIFKCDNLLQN